MSTYQRYGAAKKGKTYLKPYFTFTQDIDPFRKAECNIKKL